MIPIEVQIAEAAYKSAYNKIKQLVLDNREKYKGTKFEDCPPLIDEQAAFFVRFKEVKENREKLKNLYGICPLIWAHWLTWYEKNCTKKNSI